MSALNKLFIVLWGPNPAPLQAALVLAQALQVDPVHLGPAAALVLLALIPLLRAHLGPLLQAEDAMTTDGGLVQR